MKLKIIENLPKIGDHFVDPETLDDIYDEETYTLIMENNNYIVKCDQDGLIWDDPKDNIEDAIAGLWPINWREN